MPDTWHFAINEDEFEGDDVLPVTLMVEEIAVYRAGGQFYASDDLCTHGQARLSEGVVVGNVIECPLHQGRFCLRTGKALSPPVVTGISTYPVKVAKGKVYVELQPAGERL